MEETGAGADELHTVVLEESCRLSHSLLWQIQRHYFDHRGVEGWRRGLIPQYITTNSYIARAYARVVLGYLRDCLSTSHGGADSPCSVPSQPIHIVELDRGSGRFAYHFMAWLMDWLDQAPLDGLAVRYVITDFSASIVEHLRTHPSFSAWVETGRLDFATFDAARDREIVLAGSGDVLAPGKVTQPMVVIANYVFDTMPQDAFAVRHGELLESLVTLRSSQPEPDLNAHGLMDRIKISYAERPVGDYYGDTDFDRILAGYRDRLGSTGFAFPVSALECVRNLEQIAGGKLLLLAGDKGYSTENDMVLLGDPEFAQHDGSVSMMVSFHALGQYVLDRGGQYLHPQQRPAGLEVCAFLLGRAARGHPETRLAFEDFVCRGGPDDFCLVETALEKAAGGVTVQEALAWLRMSGWDPQVFHTVFPALMKALEAGSEYLHQDISAAIRAVWKHYYPIGEAQNMGLASGLLLYAMKRYPEAMEHFQWSLAQYGPTAGVLFDIAACHYGMRQLDLALERVNQSLQTNPTFETARALRIRIESELG